MRIYRLEKKDIEFANGLLDAVAAEALGQPGYYTLLSADDDDIPVGVLQFYIGKAKDYGVVGRVTYIFVVLEERENDVANELALELISILQDSGIGVCEVTIPESENTEILKYVFSSFGFLFDKKDEYPYYEIPIGHIVGVPILSKGKLADIKPLTKIKERQFKYLIGEIKRHDSNDFLSNEISINPDDWEKDISCFYLGEKGGGAFLVRKNAAGVLEPKFLSGFGRDTGLSVLGLISYGTMAAGLKYPHDTILMIPGRKVKVNELVKKICPDIVPKKMSLGRFGA